MKTHKFEIEFEGGLIHTIEASSFVAGQAVTFYDEKDHKFLMYPLERIRRVERV